LCTRVAHYSTAAVLLLPSCSPPLSISLCLSLCIVVCHSVSCLSVCLSVTLYASPSMGCSAVNAGRSVAALQVPAREREQCVRSHSLHQAFSTATSCSSPSAKLPRALTCRDGEMPSLVYSSRLVNVPDLTNESMSLPTY